jgi:ABC-type antimicrobial peptide transport system permease subunit
VPPGLPKGTVVIDRDSVRATLLSEPMSGVAQRAVQALAIAAALLALLGFTVSVAGSVRERRGQSALLAALGVDAAARARQLCAEVLALSVPAAATGLLLGTVLARLLVPAVTLTPTGSLPLPPAQVEVPLGQAALLALIVSAIPVIAAAATAAYRPDPAAELRASEAV